MAKRYSNARFIVFLLNFILVLGKEHEETHPSDEYIEIFRNIPTLFEYLLEVLEERPHVLEKNDIAVFKRNAIKEASIEECAYPKDKRNVDIYECTRLLAKLSDDNNNSEVFKRNADPSDSDKANYDSKEKVYPTTANKYDQSKTKYERRVNKLTTDDINGRNAPNYDKEYYLQFKTEKNSVRTDKIQPGMHKQQKLLNGDAKKKVKRQNLSTSNKFYLTPEDVEEQAIKVEKMLEEHNSKEK